MVPDQWEYKAVTIRLVELEQELNKLGADGWKLMSSHYGDAIFGGMLMRPCAECPCCGVVAGHASFCSHQSRKPQSVAPSTENGGGGMTGSTPGTQL